MSSQIKEGIVHALFFIIAIGLLVYNTFGILTIPGIIAGFTSIGFLVQRNYYVPAIFGILAASGSFIGQYFVAFCPYCAGAAFCFLIGGLLSLRHVFTKMLPISIALVVAISSSATLFVFAPVPVIDTRAVAATTEINLPEELPRDKPLLFISTSCKACEDSMEFLIKKDPLGETWTPVVTPDIALEKGRAMLEKEGYKGMVLSASSPPGRKFPALLVDDQLYEGTKHVENYFAEKGK